MSMFRESNAIAGRNARARSSLLDGLFRKNPVFVGGLVIAPVVVAATNAVNALILAIAFSAVTFVAVMSASFIPRSLVYTIRIILYTIIAALVYMPTVVMIRQYFPNATQTVGIYLPLLVTNSLIAVQTETRFFQESKAQTLVDVTLYILGFDAAVLLVGCVRELLTSGSLFGSDVPMLLNVHALAQPFGGFILLGLLAAVFRMAVKGWSPDGDTEK